jgi:hypothetical protein
MTMCVVFLQGIAGLQSLSELRASHNHITTLRHMRALPNLKEMNVSNNQLTNLIGLELLPSIQAISAGVCVCVCESASFFLQPSTFVVGRVLSF